MVTNVTGCLPITYIMDSLTNMYYIIIKRTYCISCIKLYKSIYKKCRYRLQIFYDSTGSTHLIYLSINTQEQLFTNTYVITNEDLKDSVGVKVNAGGVAVFDVSYLYQYLFSLEVVLIQV